MFGTTIGAGVAVFVRCWANAIGKQRYFARPWNHVFLGAVGGYIGYNYSTWENGLLVAVNAKRIERGMPVISRKSVTDFSQPSA
ncbi:hypothetical protein B484DRAFT_451268 [Ochromonadaceae sp. CCMP2298]|nr:hypothetical protein B484DRAFT_451268 [Ochromonadaceae sp. CCMP2298]|mmetsp:Transcript_21945/g.48770  ORF Transcript_21945/g.48770 Transcript_21945/m.48770 type:complete len:84 (+) Transcript_21945:80-331(+)|eukprot:CAMPEP_0173175228 /NCGR_PEP_ID=MMETSP1141-20130122/3796_1 /TAXON_ID=483371 /ORGANISM="non described non described, Strain CCMP2298" /LENGTH=83 /DNA_ID=CAMNT_0014097449 /DNA_START=87 /DNA_END=338 /DNA_ORIENTATION=-